MKQDKERRRERDKRKTGRFEKKTSGRRGRREDPLGQRRR